MDSIANSAFVNTLTPNNIVILCHTMPCHNIPYQPIPNHTTNYDTIPVVNVEVLNHLELLFANELLLEAPVCIAVKLDTLPSW